MVVVNGLVYSSVSGFVVTGLRGTCHWFRGDLCLSMNWKIPIKLKDPVVAEEKRKKVFFRRKNPLEQIDNLTVKEVYSLII